MNEHRPPAAALRQAAAALGGLLALTATLVVGAALALAGCSRRADLDMRDQASRAASETEWAWLVAAKGSLDAQRARLAAGGAGAGGGAAGGAAGGGGADSTAPLAHEAEKLARELDRRLVAYINAQPPLEGIPLSARQLAAIRMKSDEDIVAAHEFIARAGDYRRACDIYEAALAADPLNPRLHAELARARAARYMTAERFAHAAPGMSAEEVRAALGPPNARDVRTYPDKAVTGWFYPRDAAGTAAAVWLRQRDGRLTVYRCDWTALPAAPAPPTALAAPPAPAPEPALPAGQEGSARGQNRAARSRSGTGSTTANVLQKSTR
jgi:hypothetical protein